MKMLLAVAVLGAGYLFASANVLLAADHSQVPSQMLASMGLSTMQPMSDAQGLAIRGKGRGSVTVQKNTV